MHVLLSPTVQTGRWGQVQGLAGGPSPGTGRWAKSRDWQVSQVQGLAGGPTFVNVKDKRLQSKKRHVIGHLQLQSVW